MKLICKQSPRVLGIENERGDWSLKAFEGHLKSCDTCREFEDALKADIAKHIKHGGWRPGAGRKPEPVKMQMLFFRAAPIHLHILDRLAKKMKVRTRSEVLRALIEQEGQRPI